MTARIFIKLILAVTGVLAVALVAVNVIATPRVRENFLDALKAELAGKARTMEASLPHASVPELAKAAGGRVTWIAPDGRVLADSEASAEQMENHASRPEVAEALAGRTGASLRTSSTVGTEYFYVAVPVAMPERGSALRLAVASAAVDERVRSLRNAVWLATGLAFIPAALLAAAFARSASNRLGGIIDFARGLAQGNFGARLESGGGELGALSANLNETGEKLQFMMARLESEHAELERLERVRRDFVINVSHELRTPLASIQGYAETLLDGAIQEPENARKFLAVIQENAARLTRLSADLLVLSRLELGQREMQTGEHRVAALLESNADTVRPLAEQKGLALRIEPGAGDSTARADAEAVHQILTNLLENAIKFTPAGGEVTMGARPAGGEVVFYVRDTGPGIPKEDQSRLFERFYRVDKARSNALGGTGLGLSIVKHLTQAQEGRVWVESTPGRGSTFHFTLPRGEDA